ncbi:MAG: type III-A CRISPR-associated protein Csm2 [Thermoflavifilum sp.]|nr:type III-A CRISPR-associated protein Csm2 [Thermoflavifilum sp.]
MKQNSHQKRHNQHSSNDASNRGLDKHFIDTFKDKWIEEELDEEFIKYAEDFGKFLKENDFTTSQIRNFFGEVRRIQMKGISKEKTAFLLIRPKLAYAASRAGHSAKAFEAVMRKAHEIVMRKESQKDDFEKRFKNFVDFFEAILAYHKAAGGK